MFTSLLSFISLGMLLVIVGLTIGLIMALVARKSGGASPIVVAQGAAQKLIGIAMTGNVDALLAAAVDSFHLHLADGSLGEKLLKAGFAEVQRNVNDPNGKTPIVDAVAMLTGKSRQQVLDLFKADLDGPAAPAATPAPAVAVAALLLLCLAIPASGADTWGMAVKGPQRFYERDTTPIKDPPLMRDARGQLVEYQAVSYVRYTTSDTVPVQPPNGTPIYYQTACQSNAVGFWGRGPVRRWIAYGGPVRRWLFRGRRGC
jgi:hypothetical protein